MPEWITPLLWPVWCAPMRASLSTSANRRPGRRRSNSRALASPTIPAPTTTTSYVDTPGIVGGSGLRARLADILPGLQLATYLTDSVRAPAAAPAGAAFRRAGEAHRAREEALLRRRGDRLPGGRSGRLLPRRPGRPPGGDGDECRRPRADDRDHRAGRDLR